MGWVVSLHMVLASVASDGLDGPLYVGNLTWTLVVCLMLDNMSVLLSGGVRGGRLEMRGFDGSCSAVDTWVSSLTSFNGAKAALQCIIKTEGVRSSFR